MVLRQQRVLNGSAVFRGPGRLCRRKLHTPFVGDTWTNTAADTATDTAADTAANSQRNIEHAFY